MMSWKFNSTFVEFEQICEDQKELNGLMNSTSPFHFGMYVLHTFSYHNFCGTLNAIMKGMLQKVITQICFSHPSYHNLKQEVPVAILPFFYEPKTLPEIIL